MKDSTATTIGVVFVIIAAIVAVGLIGMFAWGFVEIIQWLTSK